MQLRATSLRAIKTGGRRRAWTPAELGANLALWLDAEDAASITLNGSTVSQWSDKSGNNRHATQATAANQPLYLSNFNGKPALQFNGTSYTLSAPLPLSGNDISLIAVTQRTGITNSLFRWQSGPIYFVYPYGLHSALSNDGGVSTANNPANGFVNDTYGIASYHRQRGVSKTTFWNGVQQGSTSSIDVALPSVSTLFIGSVNGTGEFYNGYAGELLITTTAVSIADRQKLEGYLAWKWGLVADLPVGHPFKNNPPTV